MKNKGTFESSGPNNTLQSTGPAAAGSNTFQSLRPSRRLSVVVSLASAPEPRRDGLAPGAPVRPGLTRLQLALLIRPEQGVLIRGSGGLRKLRWGARGRGKRGGVRVIYDWHPGEPSLYMLLIYAKAKQDDLTPAQVRVLRRLVQEEFG